MTSVNLASPHGQALDSVQDVEGRSLWQDAWRRLLRNRAAVASLIVLAIISTLCFLGPYALPWDYDEIDWDHIEALPPSFELGHYLGTDYVGRDILARTLVADAFHWLVGCSRRWWLFSSA
ncbi:MAG: hypothetical protein RLN70_01335 [Rhodospirillaceae bacterium]